MKNIKAVLSRRIWKLSFGNWLMLILGLAVFVSLSLATITKSSIWFDEAFGAYMAKFSFFDIARYTSFDVHPPLFYWALKLWGTLFGWTELGLRSMSVFWGCITIIFSYLLIGKLFNQKTAKLTLLFLVISPMLIRYGQEMRMYTMIAAIAMVATYALVVAMESKRKLPWIIYGILISLGMWTHYFIVLVWLAHWVWRASVVQNYSDRKTFFKKFFDKNWVTAHLVALGLFLPWLPFLFRQVFVVQVFGFWIPPVTVNTIPDFLTNVLYYLNADQTNGWLAAVFVAIVVLLLVIGILTYRRQGKKYRQAYNLIAILAFLPVITLFVLSLPPMRSYFIDRYLIVSAVSIAILIAVTLSYGLKLLPAKARFVPIILVVGVMGIGISNVYRLGNYNKNSGNSNNTRQIIEATTSKALDEEPIIAATPWFFYEAVFYTTDDHPVYYIAPDEYLFGSLEMLKDNNDYKINDITSFTQQHSTLWYVGCPGEQEFSVPYKTWHNLQEITVNDSVSGKPLYKAIQYQID